MKLEFSESAIQDLIRLREFITVHNPKAAERISLRLRQAIAKLVLYPDIGSVVFGIKPLDVATCNTNQSNLQSRDFQTRIICNYNFI
jgi:plasmid stabilization system protein ParE